MRRSRAQQLLVCFVISGSLLPACSGKLASDPRGADARLTEIEQRLASGGDNTELCFEYIGVCEQSLGLCLEASWRQHGRQQLLQSTGVRSAQTLIASAKLRKLRSSARAQVDAQTESIPSTPSLRARHPGNELLALDDVRELIDRPALHAAVLHALRR